MSRYFFALWPDQAIRKKIINYRLISAPAGKLIPEKNFHITLLFMGKLNINQVQKIIFETTNMKLPGFSIQLNQSGYFSKSKVNWLSLKSVPDALVRLHYALSACAQKSRVPLEKRQYTPHLTLARKSLPTIKLVFAPIDWNINHFVLIESTDTPQGVHYQIIKDFPLLADKD
jgi:2'-5' RNA ligase